MISIGLVIFIMLINLRGVKESGVTLAIPTYYFIGIMAITVMVGIIRYLTGSLGQVMDPPTMHAIESAVAVTPFLILHAFSSGTAALTGIEAISDGIQAFKEPRSRNAGITLVWMASILAAFFLAISFLASQIGAVPSEEETVISQLARTIYGGQGPFYLALIAGTTVILIMATNTSYADFPRLSAFLAMDSYLPRQFAFRGSRLVYSTGIVALAAVACALIIIFQASVTRLIPLYAVGVFLSFTLSQSGMARRWWKAGHLKPGEKVVQRGSTLQHDRLWKLKMVINGFGALCTLVVVLVFAVTKFAAGAWVVLILIPILVAVFTFIHTHYKNLARRLSLENYGAPARIARHRVILLVSSVHRGTLAALRYALTLSDDITAVHVSMDPAEAEKVKQKWETWGDGLRLVMLDSPYRLLAEPLLEYIEDVAEKRQPNEIITIVVPQFVSRRWYSSLLHTNTAFWLRMALIFKPGIVITDVPYQVD